MNEGKGIKENMVNRGENLVIGIWILVIGVLKAYD